MRISAVWYPVRQWEAATQFYGELLGLRERQRSDAAGWVAYATDDGPPLFLVRRPDLVGGPAGRGNGTVTLETPDLDGFRTRLLHAGVRVEAVQPGATRIFTFYDPDGNRLEAAERAGA